MTTTDTSADQINAAGVLLAILTAHRDLPAPDVHMKVMAVPGTYEWTWGLYIALHDGLNQFEQWRTALDLDPATVERKHHGATAWLVATGTHCGAPVELYGFYPRTPDDER